MSDSTSKLQVRLISPWQKYCETNTAVFSDSIPAEKADALLCEWAPHPELFTFPRRKAWYCCEPSCQFVHMERGTWPELKTRLADSEFLYHGHSDLRYRVPHITHFQPLTMQYGSDDDRLDRAIAIVSNHGGAPRMRHPEIADRNRYITQPAVDLFGRSGWNRYRPRWFSWPGPPANYQGEIPGDWPSGEKRSLQAKYKVAICLENMSEPHYFTEKLVEAVVAGCIPVYKAHDTLRDTLLHGASWIDPQDFGDEPAAVLNASLKCSFQDAQRENALWLAENTQLQETNAAKVFQRIGDILSND